MQKGELQLVTFNIAKETFSISILNVCEIINMRVVVEVPQSPPFICGVINLRGQIIPIINLYEKFKFIKKDINIQDKYKRIVVCRSGNIDIGFVVDSIGKIYKCLESEVAVSPIANHVNGNFISGMLKEGEEIIQIIDMDKFLTNDEKAILSKGGDLS